MKSWIILVQDSAEAVAENPVRHIETLRELEAHKRHYQIRCSHHELELAEDGTNIVCSICGKLWKFAQQRGFREPRKVFTAEKDE